MKGGAKPGALRRDGAGGTIDPAAEANLPTSNGTAGRTLTDGQTTKANGVPEGQLVEGRRLIGRRDSSPSRMIAPRIAMTADTATSEPVPAVGGRAVPPGAASCGVPRRCRPVPFFAYVAVFLLVPTGDRGGRRVPGRRAAPSPWQQPQGPGHPSRSLRRLRAVAGAVRAHRGHRRGGRAACWPTRWPPRRSDVADAPGGGRGLFGARPVRRRDVGVRLHRHGRHAPARSPR